MSDSVSSISTAIGQLVNVAKAQVQATAEGAALSTERKSSAPPMKYEFVWKLLESLYENMDESDIHQINHQAINTAYEKSYKK